MKSSGLSWTEALQTYPEAAQTVSSHRNFSSFCLKGTYWLEIRCVLVLFLTVNDWQVSVPYLENRLMTDSSLLPYFNLSNTTYFPSHVKYQVIFFQIIRTCLFFIVRVISCLSVVCWDVGSRYGTNNNKKNDAPTDTHTHIHIHKQAAAPSITISHRQEEQ